LRNLTGTTQTRLSMQQSLDAMLFIFCQPLRNQA
jgi:hypothetical protein